MTARCSPRQSVNTGSARTGWDRLVSSVRLGAGSDIGPVLVNELVMTTFSVGPQQYSPEASTPEAQLTPAGQPQRTGSVCSHRPPLWNAGLPRLMEPSNSLSPYPAPISLAGPGDWLPSSDFAGYWQPIRPDARKSGEVPPRNSHFGNGVLKPVPRQGRTVRHRHTNRCRGEDEHLEKQQFQLGGGRSPAEWRP